jgi:hypothetical protein
MPNHIANCDCIRCQLARGYVEMASINLNESRTYQQLEDEASTLRAWEVIA